MGAIAGNLSAVRFDPSNLGVTKLSESNWIVVDCGYSVDCFGDPESQVGDLTRELMGVLRGEALKLIQKLYTHQEKLMAATKDGRLQMNFENIHSNQQERAL